MSHKKPTYFTGTVEMNIRYGAAPKPKYFSSRYRENACRLSKADEFISRLEGGYQYIVSQGGTNLSGRSTLTSVPWLERSCANQIYLYSMIVPCLDGTTERARSGNCIA